VQREVDDAGAELEIKRTAESQASAAREAAEGKVRAARSALASGKTNKGESRAAGAEVSSLPKRGNNIWGHNRERSLRRECGGSRICEHNRQRTKCVECKGSGICEHNRQQLRGLQQLRLRPRLQEQQKFSTKKSLADHQKTKSCKGNATRKEDGS